MEIGTISSPLGLLRLVSDGGQLLELSILSGAAPAEAPPCAAEDAVLREAFSQLNAYFAGRLRDFSLPLAPAGTAFQKRAWAALQTIPYGETRSYGEQAALLGNPRACRAVGGANHRNPIAIVIPCHRVIGAGGKLVGYGGGLEKKEFLLALERG